MSSMQAFTAVKTRQLPWSPHLTIVAWLLSPGSVTGPDCPSASILRLASPDKCLGAPTGAGTIS